MAGLTEQVSGGKFLNIIQGSLRMPCDEDNPKAVKRKWEAKDGSSGVKYEIPYTRIAGFLTGLEFVDGEYGEQLFIKIRVNDEDYVVTTQSDSRYATDFLKRLPNADLSDEMELTPYDIEDNGKRNTGIKISQRGETIKNFFWDYDNKKLIHGFPEIDWENSDKDDRKVYFIEVKKFLKKYTINKLTPQLASNIQEKEPEKEEEYEDDLPF